MTQVLQNPAVTESRRDGGGLEPADLLHPPDVKLRCGRPLWLHCCWASELDLMVRVGGLRLRERYQDWVRGPFTGES